MDIDIPIPKELIEEKQDKINYRPIEKKTIIGLCGYSKSGKDTLGRFMTENLGFKRFAFGDTLKICMNNHMKKQVYKDLKKKGVQLYIESIDFLNPKSSALKEVLRPYMIWFGEKLREINGRPFWINKTFSEISNYNKIVITDVRRPIELEPFKNSKTYNLRSTKNKKDVGVIDDGIINEMFNDASSNNYKSLLIHINQRNLIDSDELTVKTIRLADEQWLFDDTVYIDSNIPEKYRNNHMRNHLLNLINKFPDYFV